MGKFWLSSANYIIINNKPSVVDENYVYKIISFSKTIKLIILYEDVSSGKIRMISPDIFLEKKMIDLTTSDDLSKVFVKKYTNLHGYQFKVGFVEEPHRSIVEDGKIVGYDGNYLNTVMGALNASYNITARFRTGENDRLIDFFASTRIDLNFNVQHEFLLSNYSHAYNLYPHEIMEICVLVPKSVEVSMVRLLLQPFSNGVWLTMFIILLLLGWIWHRLNKKYSKKKLTRTEIGFQLITIQILQSFDLRSIVVPLRFKKVFVIGFTMYAFLLSQAYQSIFISNILNPFSYPDIDTVQQLNQSGLRIIAPSKYVRDISSEFQNELTHLIKNDTSFENALNHDFEPYTAYIVSKTEAYSVINSDKNYKTGRPAMHLMKEVLYYAPQNYLLDYRVPFHEEINDQISRIRESGLYQYWQTLTFGREEIKYKRKLAQLEVVTIDFEKFQKSLYVLVIGYGLATIVFVFEYNWARIQRFLDTYVV
jgi:hypothetical protein